VELFNRITCNYIKIAKSWIDYLASSPKWKVDTERDASEFDAMYYGKLLEKAWNEVAFVFKNNQGKDA